MCSPLGTMSNFNLSKRTDKEEIPGLNFIFNPFFFAFLIIKEETFSAKSGLPYVAKVTPDFLIASLIIISLTWS